MGMYSKPNTYNLAMASASNEYSQALPTNTKKIVIRSRGTNDLRLAWVSGETATSYITIPAGSSFQLDGVWLRGATVYLRSSGASDTAEILAFSDFS